MVGGGGVRVWKIHRIICDGIELTAGAEEDNNPEEVNEKCVSCEDKHETLMEFR